MFLKTTGIQAPQKMTQLSRTQPPSANRNDGNDFSHKSNAVTSVPLPGYGKGNHKVRLQKLH